jgi:hypothetical protein
LSIGITPISSVYGDFCIARLDGIQPTGLGDVYRRGELAVYPNPANSAAPVVVTLPEISSSVATCTLWDALGRPIRQVILAAGNQSGTINPSGLPSGVYTLRVVVGLRVYNKRLVVQ